MCGLCLGSRCSQRQQKVNNKNNFKFNFLRKKRKPSRDLQVEEEKPTIERDLTVEDEVGREGLEKETNLSEGSDRGGAVRKNSDKSVSSSSDTFDRENKENQRRFSHPLRRGEGCKCRKCSLISLGDCEPREVHFMIRFLKQHKVSPT